MGGIGNAAGTLLLHGPAVGRSESFDNLAYRSVAIVLAAAAGPGQFGLEQQHVAAAHLAGVVACRGLENRHGFVHGGDELLQTGPGRECFAEANLEHRGYVVDAMGGHVDKNTVGPLLEAHLAVAEQLHLRDAPIIIR